MNVEFMLNLIIRGGLFLYFMVKWLIITIKRKKYIKVKGKVISSRKSHSGDERIGNHCKYHFEYSGKVYDIEDNFYGGDPKLNIGDDVFFYVSPKDPNKYLKPEDLYFRKISFIGIIVFGICLLLLFL